MRANSYIALVFMLVTTLLVGSSSTSIAASAQISALIQDHKAYVGQIVTSGAHAGQFQPCGATSYVALHIPRRLIHLSLDQCPSGLTLSALESGLMSMQLTTLPNEIASKGIGQGNGLQEPFSNSDMQAASQFAGCDPSSVTKNPTIIAADELKNREQAPDQVNSAVTLQALLALGDDTDRFSTDDAATIVGYVRNVKPGGKETVNCKATDPDHTDTHIEIVASVNDTTSQPMIVEVTPRLRYLAGLQGIDWSTTALKKTLMHHWARITGWLFFDAIHADNSENINPGGPKNWRQTVWEIHPITNIEILSGPPA